MKGRALAALLLFVSCAPEDTTSPESLRRSLALITATFAQIDGDSQLKRAGGGFWEASSVGNVLRPGDWLRTGSSARARVEFVGGGGFSLEPSSVIILEATPPEQGGTPLLAVESGSFQGTLVEEKPITIRTADGQQARLTAKKRGGPVAFKLVRGAKGTELSVQSGEATLDVSGSQRALTVGRVASFSGGAVSDYGLLPSPEPLEPAEGARVVLLKGGAVRLSWRPVFGAAKYRLETSRDAAFREVLGATEVEGTGFSLVSDEDGPYAFRVAGLDDGGHLGAFSAARPFSLDHSGVRELLLSPEDGISFGITTAPPKIVLSWSEAKAGASYRVVVSTSAELKRPLVSATTRALSHHVPALPVGSYYWGVYLDGAAPEPLFSRPRRLSVRKVSATTLQAPDAVQKWGE